MARILRGVRVLLLAAFLTVGIFALPAAASHSCDDPATTTVVEQCTQLQEVNNTVKTGTVDAKTVINDNMPLVFGVAVAFVAWRVGKRVLGRI